MSKKKENHFPDDIYVYVCGVDKHTPLLAVTTDKVVVAEDSVDGTYAVYTRFAQGKCRLSTEEVE